jgi:hypothetical protein
MQTTFPLSQFFSYLHQIKLNLQVSVATLYDLHQCFTG